MHLLVKKNCEKKDEYGQRLALKKKGGQIKVKTLKKKIAENVSHRSSRPLSVTKWLLLYCIAPEWLHRFGC